MLDRLLRKVRIFHRIVRVFIFGKYYKIMSCAINSVEWIGIDGILISEFS